MEKNNKQLLIRDICARLPYGVYIKFKQYNEPLYLSVKDRLSIYNGGELINNLQYLYLRPMSSMTEEEREELSDYLCEKVMSNKIGITIPPNPTQGKGIPFIWMGDCLDWLNKKGFDYRGLIEKGLALEAPEDIYNIK